MTDLIALVNEQAEDEGLWFIDATCSEAYLQAALRKLHAAIETASPSFDSTDAPPERFVSIELLNTERMVADFLREENAKLRVALSAVPSTPRACSCHPDEAIKPCQQKYAASECHAAWLLSLSSTNEKSQS